MFSHILLYLLYLLYLLQLYVSSAAIAIVSSISICIFCIYMKTPQAKKNAIEDANQCFLLHSFDSLFLVFTTNLNIPLKYYTILPHPLHTYQGLILLVSSRITLLPQSQYIHRLSSYHYSIQLPYRHRLQDNI